MYLMLTWLNCSFGTQTMGGGGIFLPFFYRLWPPMTQTKMMNCPHCESLVQGNIMKFWSPGWMYESLLSSLPLWSNYTKSEKQSAVKGCCEYPPPQSRCWPLGLAATRSDESTLGIFADSTTSNITTNSAFVGSFALDFGEKLLYSSSWGMVPFLWDLFIQILGKISHFLCRTFHWHCLRIIFLHFPCTLYERVVCRMEDISWVSVWFTIVLLVRLISCLMTKKIASHNSLTFHHLISGLVSLHNF